MPTIGFTFESGESSLDGRSFRAKEGISQLFEISVVALSHSPEVDLESIAGKAAVVEIASGAAHVTARQRRWKGVVSYVEQISIEQSEKGQCTYRFALVPRLWLLTQRRGYRVFQHLSIPDIVDQVLAGWSIDHVWKIDRGAYPKLEYKVQYGESDYAFLSRLLEEAGIAFTFPDSAPEDLGALSPDAFDADFTPGGAGGSLLTFSDDLASGKQHSASPIHFVDKPNESAQAEFVTGVTLRHRVRPGALAVRDHDFRNPEYKLFGKAPPAPPPESDYELYHYKPGAFLVEGAADGNTPVADDKGAARHKEAAGNALATRRLEAERGGKRQIAFHTNVYGLQPGTLVGIDRHPHPDLVPGALLLVTDVEMHGKMAAEWGMIVRALFAADKYRPPLATPKPEVKGVQSATVVGPDGEEIHTDELGRVRVHFPWDRLGTSDDNSSCWVRVSQGWAGAGFGSLQLPRVGQEVLVGFLAGDPDQPIIVGRVFNAKSPVPYKLPEQRTRSTWRSSSSPGGMGFNELMFEDAKDKEQVYVQAQKDLRKLVKNDESMTIGRDRKKLVKGDEAEETRGSHRVLVGGGQDIVIKQARRERVSGDSHVHVEGDRIQKVDGDESVVSGGEIHVKADTAIVIEAARELTLKGPGGFIHIGPAGVDIVGTIVNINSGGQPGFSKARSEPEEPALAETDDVVGPDNAAPKPPARTAPAKTDVVSGADPAGPSYQIQREQVPSQETPVNTSTGPSASRGIGGEGPAPAASEQASYTQSQPASCGAVALMVAGAEIGGAIPNGQPYAIPSKLATKWPEKLDLTPENIAGPNGKRLELAVYHATSAGKMSGYSYPKDLLDTAQALGLSGQTYENVPAPLKKHPAYPQLAPEVAKVSPVRGDPPALAPDQRALEIVIHPKTGAAHYVMRRPDGTYMDPAARPAGSVARREDTQSAKDGFVPTGVSVVVSPRK